MIVATTVTVMKIAAPVCRNRIALLFDVAETFVLFDATDAGNALMQIGTIDSPTATSPGRFLAAGVNTVLCGAISRCWQDRLSRLGIEVHGCLAGDIQVIAHNLLA